MDIIDCSWDAITSNELCIIVDVIVVVSSVQSNTAVTKRKIGTYNVLAYNRGMCSHRKPLQLRKI